MTPLHDLLLSLVSVILGTLAIIEFYILGHESAGTFLALFAVLTALWSAPIGKR